MAKKKDKCCKKFKDGKRCKKCPNRPSLTAAFSDVSEHV